MMYHPPFPFLPFPLFIYRKSHARGSYAVCMHLVLFAAACLHHRVASSPIIPLEDCSTYTCTCVVSGFANNL